MSKHYERCADWICTFTGRKWHVTDPRAEDVDIEDIAHALSNICRFNGHCLEFYSVSEHSVRVMQLLEVSHPEDHQLHLLGLLHDSGEHGHGDCVRQLKQNLPLYLEIEKWTMAAIYRGLGITPPTEYQEGLIKTADNIMLVTERRDLMRHGDEEWMIKEEADPTVNVSEPWGPRRAKSEFLREYSRLRKACAVVPC